MALSGSFSGSVHSGHYTLRVDWSATQNVANNTSKITAALYLVQDNTWSLEISGRNNQASIADKSYDWSSPEIYNGGGKTTKIGTVTSDNIQHNADGTKSVTISVTFNIKATISGTYHESITASKTITLNTIPRATQPTLSPSSVNMGSNVTINLPRASSGFTHDLAYSFAGSGYTAITTGAGTSYTWQVPDLASKIPNAASGTVTIRCITKSSGKTIGTKTVLLTAKVPTTSAYMPTISDVTTTEQTSGLAKQFGAYIQGKSQIKATITAAGAKGSTIKSYSTTFAGKTYTGSSWTSGVIAQSGSLSLVTTVTDSRGRTAKKTTTISVLAYTKPTISSLIAKRANASGVEDPTNGTYVALAYKYAVTSLNEKNNATFKVEIKGINDTEWMPLLEESALSANVTAPVVTSGYQVSTDNSYDLRATLSDYFGDGTPFRASVQSGKVILDLRGDGTGIAFNKVAELPDLFDVGFPARFGAGTVSVDIPAGIDLNTLLAPCTYRSAVSAGDGTTANYANCPIVATQSFLLEAIPHGDSALLHRLSICSKEHGGSFERWYYGGAWGPWYRTFTRRGVTLWTGALYMQASHTINLSETISSQQNGIVLVFSYYADGAAQDNNFHSFFISKHTVLAKGGSGHTFNMCTANLNDYCSKYLYIHDNRIVGHDNNKATAKGNSGITYDNTKFVLRYVIGV